jgi:hypothetical protein
MLRLPPKGGSLLHIFSFTKAGTSVPDEPCETPSAPLTPSGVGINE